MSFADAIFRRLVWLALVFAGTSCGSSPAPEAKTADFADDTDVNAPSGASDEASEEGGGDEPSAAEAAREPCADGSCFACGSGFCPPGFYCDEGAQGGAACAWLPECAPKMTCDCIERVVSGCSCSERGGAPHLSCG